MSHTLSLFQFYLEIATKGLLFHFALLLGLCGYMFSCLFHCAYARNIEDNVLSKCGGEFLCLGPLDALFFLKKFQVQTVGDRSLRRPRPVAGAQTRVRSESTFGQRYATGRLYSATGRRTYKKNLKKKKKKFKN